VANEILKDLGWVNRLQLQKNKIAKIKMQNDKLKCKKPTSPYSAESYKGLRRLKDNSIILIFNF
jgi:hypothetical protein